jgi:hypothetical protein
MIHEQSRVKVISGGVAIQAARDGSLTHIGITLIFRFAVDPVSFQPFSGCKLAIISRNF